MQSSSGPFNGARVLLLEDDAVIALEMNERLADLGADVMGPFATIEAAEAALAQESPQAALLDANIAGRSSVDLALELARRGVPVAFCTGYNDLSHLPTALAAAPLLTKPVSDAALNGALARMLAPKP